MHFIIVYIYVILNKQKICLFTIVQFACRLKKYSFTKKKMTRGNPLGMKLFLTKNVIKRYQIVTKDFFSYYHQNL